MPKQIPVKPDSFAIVDDEWFSALSRHKWRKSVKGYAQNSVVPGVSIFMHEVVMLKKPKGMTIDHINGDKLDNRRSNLRFCTVAENCRNKGKHRDNTTGYKGVYKRADRYHAQITADRKSRHLGVFKNAEDAARAYDAAARTLHGEFAYFNFPDDASLSAAVKAKPSVTPNTVDQSATAKI